MTTANTPKPKPAATRSTARKAATTSGPQAARKAPAKGTAPASTGKAAAARKASPKPEQPAKAAPARPAARAKAPQPYIRKDRTRRATGSRVQVLDLLGTGAPADAIKPTEGEEGTALNYAARCVTHDQHTHHATYAAAYSAAKVSADWCTGCTEVSGDE